MAVTLINPEPTKLKRAGSSKLEQQWIAFEKETCISRKTLKHAANWLTALPIFEGDEQQTIKRIEREVFGTHSDTVH